MVKRQTLENSKPFMLEAAQRTRIERQVKEILEVRKLYIQDPFNLSVLSRETHLSTNLLSAYFHQVLGNSFNDYINRLRIHYFKESLENRDFLHFTLAAMAKQCGFHNRNTFTSAFKKVEGMTPSMYVRLYRESLYMEEAV